MTMLGPRDDEVTDVVKHHWNARAATFDQELGHGLHSAEQRDAWLELLAEIAGPPPKRVLDLGCGTGFLALLLAELGHTVTGIDLAADMLNVARQKARQAQLDIVFRLENCVSLSADDKTYNLVVARHVIWTMPDPALAVAEWLRVLRPGGRLALIEGKWGDTVAVSGHSQIRATLAAMAYAALALLTKYIGRENQPLFSKKLYDREYRQLGTRLPFSGGPPAERLVDFLEAQGLRNITVRPLMNPVLWGEEPRFPRYLVEGERPLNPL